MSEIIVAGGSGLVGGQLLDRLGGSADDSVHALLRRPVAQRRGVTQHVADPATWPAAIADLEPRIFISTLGTTIAQAGSHAAFLAVDSTLVLALAQSARNVGATHAIIVSSVGASASSSTFYLRTKGAAEDAINAMGFARVDIMRPGLLIGERSGPARPAERIAMALSPLTNLLTPRALDRYRAIDAATVAAAIAALAAGSDPGRFVHHNRDMQRLAD